jgi:hypothetical protein
MKIWKDSYASRGWLVQGSADAGYMAFPPGFDRSAGPKERLGKVHAIVVRRLKCSAASSADCSAASSAEPPGPG